MIRALCLLSLSYAAPPALPPRLAQAKQLAAQEAQLAESRAAVTGSSGPARAAAQAAVVRARAWERALTEAASAAGPQDADLVLARASASGQLLRGGETLPLRAGLLLREADQLATAEGHAELRFHDGSLLVVGPGSALRIMQAPRSFPQQSAIMLERGSLYWNAPPPPLAGLTRLLTPKTVAQFRSGSAELSLDAAGAARLSVFEGSFELSASPRAAGMMQPGWWDQIELDSK
ncbi:MAG: FecR domain-containing protein [Elusimicrobia bacterium]|nr:FecR domain-containing protein [Elusimicrobiota bacterium]